MNPVDVLLKTASDEAERIPGTKRMPVNPIQPDGSAIFSLIAVTFGFGVSWSVDDSH